MGERDLNSAQIAGQRSLPPSAGKLVVVFPQAVLHFELMDFHNGNRTRMSTLKNLVLVLASRNRKKCVEMTELLAPVGISVVPVSDFPEMPEVVEDGDSFAANAAKKACETAKRLERWVIAEDSGLCVDALNGAPGVYSARYSGEGATDERNNQKLIEELAKTPDELWAAYYVCHIAVADSTGKLRLSIEETCRGRISREPRGTAGFGYDPYFLIPEYHSTFGELGSTVKHAISHRARAMRRLAPQLVRTLAEAK